MKKNLLTLLLVLVPLFGAIPSEGRDHQPVKTVMDAVNVLHEELGLMFVYDASLDLKVAYPGTFPEIDKNVTKDQKKLDAFIHRVFDPTDFTSQVEGRYVILHRKETRSDSYVLVSETERRDTIPGVSVVALIDRNKNSTQTGFKKISGTSMRNGFLFMSQPDVIKNLQVLPGVSGGAEGMSGLHVHGGNGRDNLFQLDGVEIYSVTHLGGLFSSFNVDVIDHLDFYKSGFPARYGGKLSSVVDIQTKEGDVNEHHGVFSIGLIDGSIQADGPIVKGKSSYNVGLRRSWLDVLTAPAFAISNALNTNRQTQNMRYSLTDLNLSFTHRFSPENRLSFNFYTGGDVLRSKETQETVEYWEGARFTGSNKNNVRIGWGNILASLNWKCQINRQVDVNTIAYYTHSSANIYYDALQWSFNHEDAREEEGKKYPEMNYTTDDKRTEDNYSYIHDIGAKADFHYRPHDGNHLRFGTDLKAHLYQSQKSIDYSRDWSDGKHDVFTKERSSSAYRGGEWSLYAEDELGYLRWLKANVGLRYVMFFVKGKVYNKVEPRLALKFQLCPEVALKMSYTEMNQFTHKMSSQNMDLPSMCFLPSNKDVKPVHSKQIAGGIYTFLPHNIHVNVEGFYKTMDHLTEYKGNEFLIPSVSAWDQYFAKGKGRAYGMEAEVSWKTPDTELCAYYTLSWNERYFEEFYHSWYPDIHDNRHKISLIATHKFSRKFDVYAAWHYHTGDRVTKESHSIVDKVNGEIQLIYTTPNNFQMPDYHRLDVGMNFRKKTRKGHESVWNISLYNAYCRINTMGVTVDRNEDRTKAVGKYYGLIPLVPTFSYTYKF